jgi:hypothetical protein
MIYPSSDRYVPLVDEAAPSELPAAKTDNGMKSPITIMASNLFI